MKTYIPKENEISRDWYTVDVADQVLGRSAARIARVLRGKHKPQFTPHMDLGDFVVVVNAAKVRLTGTKETGKSYFHYSGYPGGARFETVEKLRGRQPEELVRRAVRGMLPKNRLGRRLLRKLKVYAGPDHPHAAQKPQPLTLQ
ncbi:MAG TPA: 50S ribosomal protein L13 [Acidobacteriota bacterium]|nr:50S ribosomal protein L13 [Acidobacteriota bacterium]